MASSGPVWDGQAAAAAGIGRRRLAGRDFHRVTAGAYVPATMAEDLTSRCAAVLSRVPDAVISHDTAAELLQLPVPAVPAVRIHVTVGPGTRAPRRSAVAAHVSDVPVPAWVIGGIPLTPPWRTWADCAAAEMGVPDLVALGDAVLHRWPTLGALVSDEVERRPGRRGVRVARTALGLLDGRAESAMESRVRVMLVCAGLAAPVPQLVISDGAGRFVARVDLAWPDQRLVVEYDGSHHLERGRWVRDLRRRERLEQEGWRVIVLTVADVLGDPMGVVHRVRTALHA